MQRRLGLFPTTNIVIANMIGAGIFTTSGLLMADLKSPMLMLALWIVGGIIALCGALSYGALGAAMPKAGGEYTFLSQLYNPLIGFLSGWVSFIVGFSAPIAASALGFAEYAARAFPAVVEFGDALGLSTGMSKNLLAISAIVLFTMIHMRGIEFGAKIQNGLTLLKVVLVIGLIVLGLSLGHGDAAHFRQSSLFTFNFDGWKTIGLSLMWIMFGYSGWNAAVYIGSEIKRPEKTLPRSLWLGTALVLALYFLLNVLYVYAIPPDEMQGVISVGGLAMQKLFGGPMELIVSILIAFALFSSLSAFIILGPRVYYAMARDGYFFKSIAYVHPKFNVPTRAIALQGLISIIMVISGTFDQILTYMGFSLGLFPILAVFGVYKLRHEQKIKNFGFPIVQIVYIVFSLSILLLALFERPIESSIALLTVFVGIPIFYLFQNHFHHAGGDVT